MADDPLSGIFGPKSDPLADIFGAPVNSDWDTGIQPRKPTPLGKALAGGEPEHAPVSLVDDLKNAHGKPPPPPVSDEPGTLEQLSRSFAGQGVQAIGSVASGMEEGSESVTRLMKALGDKTGTRKLIDYWTAPADWFAETAGGAIKAAGQKIEDVGNSINDLTPDQQNKPSNIIAGALGQITGLIGLSAVGGETATSLAILGQSFDQLADTMRSKGKEGTLGADAATVGAAPVMAILEKTGLDTILHGVPAPIKNRVLRGLADIAIAGGWEASEEVAQQVVQNFAVKAGADPNQSLTEGLAPNAIGGGGAGLIARMVLGGFGAHYRPRASDGDTLFGETPAATPEMARGAPLVTPQDHASPLPTELIQQGKGTIAQALETPTDKDTLELIDKYLPDVGTNSSQIGASPEVTQLESVSDSNRVTSRTELKAKFRTVESGGDDQAHSATSSASGRYQFTDGTWKQLGGDPALKDDPAEQERLMDKLLSQNEHTLANAGLQTTDGNLYLAHFLGAGGAVKALSDPNAEVDAKVQKANPFAKGWSNAQLAAWANRKMGGKAGAYTSNPNLAADRAWAEKDKDADGQELKFPEEEQETPAQPEGESYTDKANLADLKDHIEEQAGQVAEPTEAQKEAGNYKKGHINLHGLDITIETPKDGIRSGVAPDGSEWSVKMPDHYGYVKRTLGADEEQVDVYVGPKPESQRVFVIDQNHADTGKFDEHKAMLGYASPEEATAAYHSAFDDGRGPDRLGSLTEMSVPKFREWLSEEQTQPAAAELSKQDQLKAKLAANRAAPDIKVDVPGPSDGKAGVLTMPGLKGRNRLQFLIKGKPGSYHAEAEYDVEGIAGGSGGFGDGATPAAAAAQAAERLHHHLDPKGFGSPATETHRQTIDKMRAYLRDNFGVADDGERASQKERDGAKIGNNPVITEQKPAKFDAQEHVPALKALVAKRSQPLTDLKGIAKKLGLKSHEAHRVMGALAAQKDSGVYMSRKGILRRVAKRVTPLHAMEFVRSIGGVKSGRHNLRNLGAVARFPGVINNKSGRDIDEVGRALHEAGYFNDRDQSNPDHRPTESETLDLLDRASHKRIYANSDLAHAEQLAQHGSDDEEEHHRDEIRSIAEEHELNLSDDDIARALDFVAAGETHEYAVEAAVRDASAHDLESGTEQTENDFYAQVAGELYEGDQPEVRDYGANQAVDGQEGDTGAAPERAAEREQPAEARQPEARVSRPHNREDYTEEQADTLPNPRKDWRGVPDADVETAKDRNGGWAFRMSYSFGNGGAATPYSHHTGFATREEARAAGIQKLSDQLPTGEGTSYNENDRKTLARIRAWVDGLQGPTDLLGTPVTQQTAKPKATTEAAPDLFGGPTSTDVRTSLEKKGDERLRGSKEQKAAGSDGGLFDQQDTTGDMIERPGALPDAPRNPYPPQTDTHGYYNAGYQARLEGRKPAYPSSSPGNERKVRKGFEAESRAYDEGYAAAPATNQPLAAPGLTSYRYQGRYGPVMIGAKDDADALREASRSIDGEPDPAKLEKWNGEKYVSASPANSGNSADSSYGTKNKLVTKESYAEIQAKLRDKLRNQLNSGIDPELIALGTQAAVYHIEAGARKFGDFAKAMIDDFGQSVRPFLRTWYEAVRYYPGAESAAKEMSGPEEIGAALAKLETESTRDTLSPEEQGSASSPALGLESDRQGAAARNPAGEEAVSAEGLGAGQGARSTIEEAGKRGGQQPERSGELFPAVAAPVGEAGNLGLSGGSSGAGTGAADVRGRGGSLDRGEQRLDAERTPAEAVTKAAGTDASLAQKRAAQAAANKVAVKPLDRANIDATLPFLKPEQRDDVHKAEQSYTKREGFMLTNGTGTGKTFSGGGVVARYVRQGKGDILIVAPSQDIVKDWKAALRELGVEASILESTSEAGKGVTLTTYANLGSNLSLADRKWDLAVADEAHKLMSSKDASVTANLTAFRALTNHPQGRFDRAQRRLRKEWAPFEAAREANKGQLPEYLREKHDELYSRTRELADSYASEPRSKALFLSATPFAYVEAVDYANGYLFDYDSNQSEAGKRRIGGYNQPDARQEFFISNFGYRMRTGKLTKPDAGVNTEVMEREFHERLKKEGALSGRALDVDKDYDRKFVLVADGVGAQIDQALDFITSAENGRFRPLYDLIKRNFDYLKRMRLLEAINAHHAIPIIRAHHALGRKVVVFHQYNEGGGYNPFLMSIPEGAKIVAYEDGQPSEEELQPLYDEFLKRNPYVEKMDFSRMAAPIVTLGRAFPEAMFYNGRVPGKQRTANKAAFNTDNNGKNLIVVQADAGEAGISLHDTTGKQQRVTINLGMPVRPMTAIQQEGRTYRVGQMSDAVFRYLTTGTGWERSTFAQKVAERASTAENLGMGDLARALRQSFIDAYADAAENEPSADDGKGGKEKDRSAFKLTPFERAKSYYYGQQKNTKSRNYREGVDYYATPEPVGFKMAEWANLKTGEKALEPSAGHGAIARFLREDTDRTVVEPSAELASRAALASPGARMLVERFEDLNKVNKYDGVVMNPPFGTGGKTAMDHVAKAATHLRNGGRLVALIPTGQMDGRFEKWMESDAAKGIYQVGEVRLPGVAFERAGTKINSRVVILEKQTDAESVKQLPQMKRVDLTHIESVKDLFDRLEDISFADRVEPQTKEAKAIEPGADGNVTVGGHRFKLNTPKGDQSWIAKPGFINRSEFARAARLARAAGGDYATGSGFLFNDEDARKAFLEAVERGEDNLPVLSEDGEHKPIGTRLEMAETTHAKKGIPLYVAQLGDRVESDEFARLRNIAKENGGYWSSYRGAGAIPGFQFETEADRQRFADKVQAGQTPMFQTSPAFYSALERAIEGSGQNRAPAEQWLATLRRVPGVKQEELEWSGIEDLLKMQQGPVDKQMLLDLMQNGGISIDEVVLQHGASPELLKDPEYLRRLQEALDEAQQEAGEKFAENYDGGQVYASEVEDEEGEEKWALHVDGRQVDDELFDTEEAAQEQADKWNQSQEEDDFRDYMRDAVNESKIEDRIQEEFFKDRETQFSSWSSDPSNDTYRELLLTLPPGEKGNPDRAPSTHWDTEGVVAHLRFMEKADAEGQRVLFIEEVQSDWHQKGRDQGYAAELTPEEKAQRETALNEADTELQTRAKEFADGVLDELRQLRRKPVSEWINGVLPGDNLEADIAELQNISGGIAAANDANQLLSRYWGELGDRSSARQLHSAWETATLRLNEARQALNAAHTGIPDAPFKSSWPALVMKRAIRWAVDNGFDKVAWTTGEEQAERYNLDKHITRVEFLDNSSGGIGKADLEGPTTHGTVRASGHNGKVIDQHVNSPEELHNLIGKELTEKLLAQAPQHAHSAGLGLRSRSLGGLDLRVGGEGMKAFYDRNLVNITNDIVKKYGAKVERVGLAGEGEEAENATNPGFVITDKLREAAGSGFPLFQNRTATADISPDDQQRIAKETSKLLKQMLPGDRVALQFAQTLHDGGTKLNGSYFMRVIKLALDGQHTSWTLGHEALHAMKAMGLFTPTEWNLLVRNAWTNDTKMQERVRRGWAHQDLTEAQLQEEAVAEYFGEQIHLMHQEINAVSSNSFVQRILRRLANVLASVFKAIHIVRGNQKGADAVNAWKLMERMRTGKIGARPEGFGEAPRDRAARGPATVTFGNKLLQPDGGLFDEPDQPNQSMTQRQRAELEARQKQSMSRRGGQVGLGDQEGGLFASERDQGALFSVAPTGINDHSEPRLFAPIRLLLGADTSDKLGNAIDKFRYTVQDRMLPVLRTQAKVERMLGRKLGDSENPYLAEELFHGRTGARLEKLTDELVEPLFEGMREKSVTPEELETYLYARHAKERNARIQAINPEFTEGGSGMTDDEADAILAAVDASPKAADVKELAKLVDKMLAFAVQTRVDSGLLSADEAAAWKSAYQHYVPLRGRPGDLTSEGQAARINRQSGLSVKGKESRRAFGRKSRAADILAYSMLQAEEAVVRSEQNEVAKSFLELAKAAPDKSFWQVNKVRMVPVTNRTTGQVFYRAESRIAAEDAPYTVSAKVDGKEYRVTMNRDDASAAKTAAAMRNLDIQQFNFVVKTFGAVNRFMSKINTTYSPEFVISNAFRDLQTAGINLAGEGIKGLESKVLKDYPGALKASLKGAFGKGGSDWGKWYSEFKLEGGQTAFNSTPNLSELREKVAKSARTASSRLGAKRMILSVVHLIEGVNDGVENALRLSTYKNARELGLSAKQAASLAKNVTVNFNRKGTAGPLINSLYLFFNASMQGTARILLAMKSRKVQRILLGAVIAGFLLQLLNKDWSDKDKDGESFYDKIPEFEKQRNLILMLSGGEHIKIPMPWGYNVFPNFGRMLARMWQGERPMTAMGDWGVGVIDAFNPIGGAQSILDVLSPTITDPIVDLERNRDYAGRPIMPDEKDFGPQPPDAQRYWNSVPAFDRAVTDFLSHATGGDDVRPGAIDVSPETLDFLQQTVMGSAGNFVRNMGALGAKALSNDPTQEFDKNDIPFARRVLGSKPGWYDKAAFYARLSQVEQDVDYGKKYVKAGDREGLQKLFADEGDVLSLEKAAKAARKEMRGERKVERRLKEAQAKGELSDDQANAAKAKISEREKRTIDAFNRIYLGTVAKPIHP